MAINTAFKESKVGSAPNNWAGNIFSVISFYTNGLQRNTGTHMKQSDGMVL